MSTSRERMLAKIRAGLRTAGPQLEAEAQAAPHTAPPFVHEPQDDLVAQFASELSSSFAANLERLELRTALEDEEVEQSSIDVKAIATSCPRLQELTIAVTSQQYKNAVGYFCWMDACIEAVVSMPNLRRLTIDVPRVIPSGSLSIPPEIPRVSMPPRRAGSTTRIRMFFLACSTSTAPSSYAGAAITSVNTSATWCAIATLTGRLLAITPPSADTGSQACARA